jgi:hypothetical protein
MLLLVKAERRRRKLSLVAVVAATNDVPVHMIASPAISPTLSALSSDSKLAASMCNSKVGLCKTEPLLPVSLFSHRELYKDRVVPKYAPFCQLKDAMLC